MGHVKQKRRHAPLFILLTLILLMAACTTLEHMLYTYDPLNFHIVEEGVLYRSAQPSGNDLRRIAGDYHIQSVINLRGAQPGESWYDIESTVSEELGLARVDIGMSAGRLPHREDLITLLDAFRSLPRPILIHCRAGADRTGEASAIFAMEHLNWSKRRAAGQLGPFYGHIPDFKPSKSYFIRDVYEGESWARNSYDPCRGDYRYYDKASHCGVARAERPFWVERDDDR